MATKKSVRQSVLPTGKTQNRATNISSNGMTADETMRAVLTIPKEDAARIIGKKPGGKKSSAGRRK